MEKRTKTKISVSLLNDKDLILALKALPKPIQTASARDALKKSVTPILRSAKRNAQAIKDTGLLAKSIGHKAKTYRAGLVTVQIIGPRKGFKKAVIRKFKLATGRIIEKHEIADPAHYAHLVEFGTQGHSLGEDSSLRRGMKMQFGGTQHPGTKPQPFIRPAYDENYQSAIGIFKKEIRPAIVRNWEKMKRKIQRKLAKKKGLIHG